MSRPHVSYRTVPGFGTWCIMSDLVGCELQVGLETYGIEGQLSVSFSVKDRHEDGREWRLISVCRHTGSRCEPVLEVPQAVVEAAQRWADTFQLEQEEDTRQKGEDC